MLRPVHAGQPLSFGPRRALSSARFTTPFPLRAGPGAPPCSSAGSNEIPFQFHFSLNFKISYLSVWSSKYYETGFVGFIILRYIHEKC
jgi:hypothetical protein